jgi:DUF4097 and DUF4098 domain-containing protein YvlB
MKTKTKISLIIGLSLFILGAVIFVGAMFMLNWDFLKLSTVKYETNTYEINEQFSDISIITDTADITFISSDDGKTKIVCDEAVNEKHNVYISENTLKIEVYNQRKWYHHIGINFKTPKLTVYLGKNQLGNLVIKEDTGDIKIPAEFSFSSIDIKLSTGDVENYASVSADIKIETTTGHIKTENITAQNVSLTATTGKIDVTGLKASGDLKLAVSTGKTILNNITCKNITSSGSTGDLTATNTVAEGKFNVKRSTGDVGLEKCDAGEIEIVTDTGDVSGTLLSEKIFITKTDTGNIKVPETLNGGKCKITTDTGDIKITIE